MRVDCRVWCMAGSMYAAARLAFRILLVSCAPDRYTHARPVSPFLASRVTASPASSRVESLCIVAPSTHNTLVHARRRACTHRPLVTHTHSHYRGARRGRG